VPPTAGYRRLENQLYRVEVHKPGPRASATFKWSRDNGTVVTTIERISGKDVFVHDLGPDDVLGFADGQWVELSDDRSELAGEPGQLHQIDGITASQRKITLKTAPAPLSPGTDGVDPDRHPKLRRWDQPSTSGATASGVAMTSGWTALEDGVEVQFSNGSFRTGDYWVIPARTATGEIEWPPFDIPNSAPEPQTPRGIKHHYCRLALIAFDPTTEDQWNVIEDCRPIFPPLTECCDGPTTAIHVTDTNWENDDLFPLPTFVRDGFRIRLDEAPDPQSTTNDTVLVAVEVPAGTGEQANANQTHRVYIKGSVGPDPADDHVIVWRVFVPDTDALAGGGRGVAGAAGRSPERVVEEAIGRFTVVRSLFKVHVTVRGACVWADPDGAAPLVRLDGQALGVPATRADGSQRIDLDMPSGIGTTASDFESWLYLGQERPGLTSFRVTQVSFRNNDDVSSSAGMIGMPPPAGQAVTFKAAEDITSVLLTFSEPVMAQTLGAGESAQIFVTRVRGRQTLRLTADIGMEEENVVRLRLRDPQAFEPGNLVLTVVGTNADREAGGVLSVTEVAVDGDYDDQPGGDLELPFRVT
jgi:hypothetical protein